MNKTSKHTTLDPASHLPTTLKLAAAQLTPAFLDRDKCVDIVCEWIARAGIQNVDVIGFPETFISGYPSWFSQFPLDSDKAISLYKRLFLNSIVVPGPETDLIGQACQAAGVYAVVGCSERRAHTTGSMWNTTLVFGPDGTLLLKHQKYVPTVGERLCYMPGTTGAKASVETDFGGLSTLICGENSNPLAMYNLAVQSPTVHVASWPSHFDNGWSMYQCTQNATRGFAYTTKSFVINSTALIGEDMLDALEMSPEHRESLREEQGSGTATIINPMGEIIAGPIGVQEGLAIADVDIGETIAAKYTHDFGGHYNRPELFAHLFQSCSNSETQKEKEVR